MTTPDDICRIFRSLANRSRLGLLLCLAEGPNSVNGLAGALALAVPTTHSHVDQLIALGLVCRSPRPMHLLPGHRHRRPSLFQLSPAVTVTADHLAINAGGLPLTIGRQLTTNP